VIGEDGVGIERDFREAVRDAGSESASVLPITPVTAEDDREASEYQLRAEARSARAQTCVTLLKALLEGGSVEARESLGQSLEERCVFPISDLHSPEAERAFIVAESLLIGADDAAWSLISKVIGADSDFARELFLRTARSREIPIADFRDRLGASGIGQLFVALARAFPYEADPWHNGVYSPGARDNVVTWRRAMLDSLENWGGPEGTDQIQLIQTALPHYDWLGFSLSRAREHEGRTAWHPPSPADLFALADDSRRRLVRDGDELLDLVAESLTRYQRELQGELPAVSDLWDYSTTAKPRPRDEGHFADHVARFLRKDLESRGIAIGCEVVVRRGGKGRAAGLRTDIHVSATASSTTYDEISAAQIASVVIEVKGSWHPEVKSAMATQLAGKYLGENASTRHGIYLVGDFTCGSWVNGPSRRRSESLGGMATLQRALDLQASELSRGRARLRAIVLDASLPS